MQKKLHVLKPKLKLNLLKKQQLKVLPKLQKLLRNPLKQRLKLKQQKKLHQKMKLMKLTKLFLTIQPMNLIRL